MAGHQRWALAAMSALTTVFILPVPSATGSARAVPSGVAVGQHRVGLGKVVSTSDGGQIFGWDINENGTDGVLASSQNAGDGYKVSVQTFDQNTGKITKTFARDTGTRNSYGVDGIFANDIALVTRYIVPKGTFYAKRRYNVMNPVTGQQFTGKWTPPTHGFDILQNADNQSTATSVFFGIELKQQSRPALVVSDIAADTSRLIELNPDQFGLGNDPNLGQYTVKNKAVLALSPDGGTVGGLPPVNALVDLSTGKLTEWNGLNDGPVGAGFVNGLAVDSNTGIACTTTELNAEVQFYDLVHRTDMWAAQLPGTEPGDQSYSGSAVANDPLHKLFLVAEGISPNGTSTIVVFDEKGNVVESIPGFHFFYPTRVAVNPALRMGWVDGPGINQIQQFFY